MMTLDQVNIGQKAVVKAVGGEGMLRLRLLDMGVIPNTTIAVTRRAPMGDPIELQLRGYVLTLRLADAKAVEVEVLA